MTKMDAITITRARRAIDDAMPDACFPDPGQDGHAEMTAAKNVASEVWDETWDAMTARLAGMSYEQVLRAWHSLCNDVLFAFETAVTSYGT